MAWGRHGVDDCGVNAETTRLAPSPTGALHLGNARTFLITWALARRAGWRVLMRIEDLDGPRVKPGTAEECLRTLEWLGLDWDGGVLTQSHDLGPYVGAMERLARGAMAYPSELSRGDVAAAAGQVTGHIPGPAGALAGDEALSAPQEGTHEIAFPAALRPVLAAREFDQRESTWRFATPTNAVEFVDGVAGPQRHQPARTIGDFIIWTKRAQPAYQLAVVVDDHRQGVTRVVRGNDLLDSAARQLLLMRALGLGPEPRYTHLPLVRGSDGKRLAKRHGDSRLTTYRARGVAAERIVGLIAFWSGVSDVRRAMDAGEFARRFSLDTMPRSDVTFTPEDDAWLLQRE